MLHCALIFVLVCLSLHGFVTSQEVSSYTVHLMHDETHPDSVAARETLFEKFCSQFSCAECQDGEMSCALSPGEVLTTRDHQLFRLPMDLVQSALSWFMQFRTARVNSATMDLDIAVHPDTTLGLDEDYLQFRVWGGRNHPADTNKIYSEKFKYPF